MNCHQTTLEIKRYARLPSSQEVIQAAYEAVNQYIVNNGDYSIHNNYRKLFLRLWLQGSGCLFARERFYPIVTARALAMYYMRWEMSVTAVDCGKVFNMDHTTVLHNTRRIHTYHRAKFDNEIKECLSYMENALRQRC